MFLILTGEQAAGKRSLLKALNETKSFKPVTVFWTYNGDDEEIDKSFNKDIGYEYLDSSVFYKMKDADRFEFRWSINNGLYQYGILNYSICDGVDQILILEPEEVDLAKMVYEDLHPLVVYLKTDWVTRLSRLFPADQRDIVDKLFDDIEEFGQIAATFFIEGGRYKSMVQTADIVLVNDDDITPGELAGRLKDAIEEYRKNNYKSDKRLNLRFLA